MRKHEIYLRIEEGFLLRPQRWYPIRIIAIQPVRQLDELFELCFRFDFLNLHSSELLLNLVQNEYLTLEMSGFEQFEIKFAIEYNGNSDFLQHRRGENLCSGT